LVPLLRGRVAKFNPLQVGFETTYRQHGHPTFKSGDRLRVTGILPHRFTTKGPEPFVPFYEVERLSEPGGTYVVHPRILQGTLDDWKNRDPYQDAFKKLSRAMKNSGLLNDYKREAGHLRGILGFSSKFPAGGLPKSEIESYLLRTPDVKEVGGKLVIEIPTGQNVTTPFPLKLMVFPGEVVNRIDLDRPSTFKWNLHE